MSKVIVTANLDGRVIVPTGESFGYVRVEQTTDTFTDRGFAVKKTVSALVFGKLDVLKSLGWYDGQELEGKIVIKESFIPFNKKDPSKDLKVAGASNIPCTKGGRNIYRRAIYTPDASATDEFIKHDNYIPSDALIAVEDVMLTELPDLSTLVLPDFADTAE